MAANGTEIAILKPKEAAITPVGSSVTPLARYLKTKMDTIKAVVPRHFDAEAHFRTAVMLVARKPELRECSVESICQAVIDAGSLGLYLNTHLGQAWLVPFGRKDSRLKDCVMIPGYAGLIQLGYNTGLLEDIYAVSVFKGDHFEYAEGLNPKCDHLPAGNRDPKDITHVYTIHKRPGLPYRAKVYLRADIERIRAKSPQKNGPTWTNDWQPMAEKTAIRQTMKLIPKSPERLARAINTYEEHQGLAEAMDIDFDVIEAQFVDSDASGQAEAEPAAETPDDHGRPDEADDMQATLNVPATAGRGQVGPGH